jgi:hypothetical protein
VLQIAPITSNNIDRLQPAYTQFQQIAQVEYGWPLAAIGFDGLKQIISMGMLQGYLMEDPVANRVVGFMLYNIEPFGALEIKVIYIADDQPVKSSLDQLMTVFIRDIQQLDGWETVSYPMLGQGQNRYSPYITWYGFKPVGQSVVKFNMFDGISVEIFKRLQLPALPEGYRMVSWDPQYTQGVIDVLTDAFSDSADSLWDPRFRNRAGMEEAFSFVQSGGYGKFWPSCITILLNASDQPVGVCLLNIVSPEEANIPLVGILNSERKHKLGRVILAETIRKCIYEVIEGKIITSTISATVATANFAAIKMYRNTAFQEEHWYPHVYQDRDSVLKRKAGQWC